MKVYRHNEKTPMVQCDSCNWWVHASCDNMSQEQYEALSKDGAAAYTCPKCRSGDPPLWKRDDSDVSALRVVSLHATALILINMCAGKPTPHS